MDKNTHLVHLEHELETDLAEARRLVERGHEQAIAKLGKSRKRLGGRFLLEAEHEIDQYAHDADENLKMVMRRIGELNLLLATEDLKDLRIFDHFRDRIVEAMEFAEDDLENLKQRGDAWCAREDRICEAWNQLSRRLSLVRMHLVTEVGVATKEFEAERHELVKQIDEIAEAKEKHGPRGVQFVKIGKDLEGLFPRLKRFFKPRSTTAQPPGDQLGEAEE